MRRSPGARAHRADAHSTDGRQARRTGGYALSSRQTCMRTTRRTLRSRQACIRTKSTDALQANGTHSHNDDTHHTKDSHPCARHRRAPYKRQPPLRTTPTRSAQPRGAHAQSFGCCAHESNARAHTPTPHTQPRHTPLHVDVTHVTTRGNRRAARRQVVASPTATRRTSQPPHANPIRHANPVRHTNTNRPPHARPLFSHTHGANAPSPRRHRRDAHTGSRIRTFGTKPAIAT